MMILAITIALLVLLVEMMRRAIRHLRVTPLSINDPTFNGLVAAFIVGIAPLCFWGCALAKALKNGNPGIVDLASILLGWEISTFVFCALGFIIAFGISFGTKMIMNRMHNKGVQAIGDKSPQPDP